MQRMFETLNETIYSFNPQDGVTWSIAFEPLVAAMLKGSKHTDVLGLQSAHDGYSKYPFNLSIDIANNHSCSYLSSVAKLSCQFGC